MKMKFLENASYLKGPLGILNLLAVVRCSTVSANHWHSSRVFAQSAHSLQAFVFYQFSTYDATTK